MPVVKPPDAPVRTFCQSNAACPKAAAVTRSVNERKYTMMKIAREYEVKTVLPERAAPLELKRMKATRNNRRTDKHTAVPKNALFTFEKS